LRCEGCLYFSGDDVLNRSDGTETSDWERFFQEEANRGVSQVYLAGAEPSLVPERIHAAWKVIKRGVIFTNGTRRIDPKIRYKIHISIWGNSEGTTRYRGADINQKALMNYAGDDRAVAVMTLNAQNLGEIDDVAKLCKSHDIPLTFSYFSPTEDYTSRIKNSTAADAEFFRISSPESNLIMDQSDFHNARIAIEKAMKNFPETIIYSLAFDSWLAQPDGVYTLDKHGVAVDCGNRLTNNFKHYSVMMTQHSGKCCSPNLNCRECRAYAMSYGTFLTRYGKFSTDEEIAQWIDIWELWARLFLMSDKE